MYRHILYAALVVLTSIVFSSCTSEVEKPQPESADYTQAVSDFYLALGAIQADQALFAVEKMNTVAEKYPPEASAWANLAVFNMRQGNFEGAEKQIKKALERDEDNAQILFLAGILESRRGNVDKAINYLRKAAKAEPGNNQIAFALAEELQRQDASANNEEVFTILHSILERQPDNLAVLLEMVRVSVKSDNPQILQESIKLLSQQSGNWPEEVQKQYKEIRSNILSGQTNNLTFELAFLRNNLNQLPQFQSDVAAVQIPPSQVGFLITDFTWLPDPSTSVALPDTGLTFHSESRQSTASVDLIRAVALSDSQRMDEIVVKSGRAIINGEQEVSFPGQVISGHGVETIDFDYDFLNDLALAGSGGLKLYRQQDDSTFTDATSSTGLAGSILSTSYYGLWSRDIDLDGDLDLVMSPRSGSAFVLRNNGDGTFTKTDFFNNVYAPLNFAWADFDGDADSDAVFLDKTGDITLYLNERSSEFRKVEDIPLDTGAVDITVSDINSDSNFDLLVWNEGGIHRIYFEQETGSWQTQKLVEVPPQFGQTAAGGGSLYSVDLDNNGANDLIISTPGQAGYWLTDENLQISTNFRNLPANIKDIANINDDTRLDLLSLDEKGEIHRNINSGSKNYLARIIRPQASGPLGDRRINSFGIGGAIEIRSGLLYQKQLIRQPSVHLGLGNYEEAEMLRIIWPNGSSQTEFAELGYGSKIFNEQILKGSCPWVFTYNGKEMEFVTDFLWRTGLGIRINAQGSADVIHSIDWIKVDGNQLKSRNGEYDIRITADLWETHFFDHVSLKAIDHPEGTEVFVDERFSFPPQQPKLHVLQEPRPVAGVVDQDGRDVTEKVREDDRQYVDSFELTKYQGLAEDHYVEVDLGNNLPDKGLRLIALGWVYPTDTSINIALSQGDQPAPYPLRLEVPDGSGGWKVARKNIGFPAGKSKTMIIDLDGIFEPGTKPRLRLVTNMEIYWNQIRWAVEEPNGQIEERDIEFTEANLRYRGFSEVKRPGRFIPEQPNYQQVSGTTPMWYDLEGFYTRFGEVNELMKKTDDRYVIMNAGDELVFKFPSLNEPAAGQTRDFVLVGDGWVKDGDFNTGFSKTVLPLPYHGMEDYSEAPAGLREDPVFQKHKQDWINYHTRYVTPGSFRSALIFND